MRKIEALFSEWQKLQPLKPEDKKRLNDKLNLEFNFNTNHIEGNTLTYGQTKMLLLFGESMGDAKMRDLEEMKAHSAGLRWIREVALDKEYRLNERDIRDLNRIILAEDFYKIDKNGNRYLVHVGVYKTRPNSVITVTGEEFAYASPQETPMMSELVRWINEEIDKGELSPVELAALMHYRYIRIHPFEDGNGRIARLLVAYILERAGYPMVIIKSSKKEEYLNVLHRCDIEVGLTPSDGANASVEQVRPFVDYLKREAEWSLSIAIRAAKGESIEEGDDWRKKLKTKYPSKIGAPERTEELESIARDKSFIALFEFINNELREFYSLFDTFELSLPGREYFSNDGELYSNIFLRKGTDSHRIMLSFIPEQFKFKIKIDIDNTESFDKEYRYDQVVEDVDRKEMLNFIGQFFVHILEQD